MRVRNRQMKTQGGLCYYCDQPMWLQDINGFCGQYGIDRAQALSLKCTAEHLIARTDGGPETDKNIVAACHYCNQARHRVDNVLVPETFRIFVRTELASGRWHGLCLSKGVAD